jgi:hypothetical protein
MSDFFVTGKKRNGKSLIAVKRMKDYLLAGKPVATNIDIFVEHLLGEMEPVYGTRVNSETGQEEKTLVRPLIYRLPDKPRVEDLEAIGRGSDVPDDETYGLIVLDECGLWMNARNWQDKERKALLDWLAHSGKKGWDVYYLVHDLETVDAQIRRNFCEHLVVCRRLDRLRIPIIGAFLQALDMGGHLPKVHFASVHYGDTDEALVVQRWWYTGKDLYKAYDTRQGFRDESVWMDDPQGYYDDRDKAVLQRDTKNKQVLIDLRATYQVLPPTYITGKVYEKLLNERFGELRALDVELSKAKSNIHKLREHRRRVLNGQRDADEKLVDVPSDKYQDIRARIARKRKIFSRFASFSVVVLLAFLLYSFFGDSHLHQAQAVAQSALPAALSVPAALPATASASQPDAVKQSEKPSIQDPLESLFVQYEPYLTGVSVIGQRQMFTLTFFDSGRPVKTITQREFIEQGWTFQATHRAVRVWRDGLVPRYISLIPVAVPSAEQQKVDSSGFVDKILGN